MTPGTYGPWPGDDDIHTIGYHAARRVDDYDTQDHLGEPAPHVEWQARDSAGSYVMLGLGVLLTAGLLVGLIVLAIDAYVVMR